VFDNNGIPYSFKTKAAEVVVPTIPVVTPTVIKTTCEGVDYDKNGVVNSLDMIRCLKAGVTLMPTTNEKCPIGVDYDKNGSVNSLDRIKCLQSTSQ
jgi:hypothetical protein